MKKSIFYLNFMVILMICFLIGSESVYAGSSGSCCIYESENGKSIYFYTLTNESSNTKSPAICFGNNCITNDFSKPNVQLINLQNQPWWWSYANNISDCRNMPSDIWYDDSGSEIKFYASDSSSSLKIAHISPGHQCRSNLTFSSFNTSSGFESGEGCPVELRAVIVFLKRVAFNTVQMFVPIILIVMGSVDFFKAVASSDDKGNKEAISKFIKRCLAALIVFFIGTIVSVVMNMFAKTDVGAKNDWKTCWQSIK